MASPRASLTEWWAEPAATASSSPVLASPPYMSLRLPGGSQPAPATPSAPACQAPWPSTPLTPRAIPALSPVGHVPMLPGVVGLGPILWEVVAQGGVNVRAARDVGAQVFGGKCRGEVVLGRQEGDWVALMGEPGFMLLRSGEVALLQPRGPAALSPRSLRWDGASPPAVAGRPLAATPPQPHVGAACSWRPSPAPPLPGLAASPGLVVHPASPRFVGRATMVREPVAAAPAHALSSLALAGGSTPRRSGLGIAAGTVGRDFVGPGGGGAALPIDGSYSPPGHGGRYDFGIVRAVPDPAPFVGASPATSSTPRRAAGQHRPASSAWRGHSPLRAATPEPWEAAPSTASGDQVDDMMVHRISSVLEGCRAKMRDFQQEKASLAQQRETLAAVLVAMESDYAGMNDELSRLQDALLEKRRRRLAAGPVPPAAAAPRPGSPACDSGGAKPLGRREGGYLSEDAQPLFFLAAGAASEPFASLSAAAGPAPLRGVGRGGGCGGATGLCGGVAGPPASRSGTALDTLEARWAQHFQELDGHVEQHCKALEALLGGGAGASLDAAAKARLSSTRPAEQTLPAAGLRYLPSQPSPSSGFTSVAGTALISLPPAPGDRWSTPLR